MSSARSTRRSISSPAIPRTDSGNAMFSATLMCGNNA